MKLVMLGAPGAGKGTQARWLAKDLDIPHISTGQIFREALEAGAELGREAKRLTDRGEFVPDEIVMGIILPRLEQPDCRDRGFIFDGFPRTLPQAEALDRWLMGHATSLDRVIELIVAPETIVDRLSGRLLCKGCGKDFNVQTRRPRGEAKCDYCGGKLERRSDDEPDAIRRRLEVEAAKTRPLHDYYAAKGLLAEFSGTGTMEEIFRSILAALGRKPSERSGLVVS